MSSEASDLSCRGLSLPGGHLEEVSPALWLPYINTVTFTTWYLESPSLLEGRMQIAWRFPAAIWEAVRAEHRCGLGSEGSPARGRLCRFSSRGEMRSLLLSPTA